VTEHPPPPSEQTAAPPRHRLDPDAAAAAGSNAQEPTPDAPVKRSEPVIDVRPYRWMIGVFGLLLVLVISVYQFAAHGIGTVGIPAGKRLHFFAAPLATSNLNGDANLNPPCSSSSHDPRALNICLLVQRGPLALAFFVPSSSDCNKEVDVLQTISARVSGVRFAAIAVRAGRSDTASVVRAHRWTMPVAYDRDGAVGAFYGVETCPMVELAYRGGVVADRLIGDHWLALAPLESRIRALQGRSK
jgi:hypothetical protein